MKQEQMYKPISGMRNPAFDDVVDILGLKEIARKARDGRRNEAMKAKGWLNE